MRALGLSSNTGSPLSRGCAEQSSLHEHHRSERPHRGHHRRRARHRLCRRAKDAGIRRRRCACGTSTRRRSTKAAAELGKSGEVYTAAVELTDEADDHESRRCADPRRRQDRHPREQCRHHRRQRADLGARAGCLAARDRGQSRRAVSDVPRRRAAHDARQATAGSSTSPRLPARKAIRTPRIIRRRKRA